jgi:hypothetical protein
MKIADSFKMMVLTYKLYAATVQKTVPFKYSITTEYHIST